ncbi:MAG: DegT/DnrJ/EryC1/StrS family aminotransferase [Gammaproteobacteria bacterium]|nr:DegT/DnrJ/EryC1/StrS family aminotransferase [Gammaproteobacteria bacterium]
MSQPATQTRVKVPFVNFKRRYELLKPEIDAVVQAIFASGTYILGEPVEAFEKRIAEYLGCRYVLGVANGTDALIMVLKMLEIGPGDEVIVPVNSFVASAASVAAVGATPVFCDVREDLNMDPADLKRRLTERTRAILPVHLTGRPADMQAIMDIAEENGCVVIEDAAQSIGASSQGRMTGTLGVAGCFSLHPLKNLQVYGDGGLITLNDETLYKKLRLYRNHGLLDRDTCVSFGINSRLDTVQAGIALVGMKHLDAWTTRRQEIAKRYQDAFRKVAKVPEEQLGDVSVYHNFVMIVERRDELMNFLAERGIETKIHYPVPLHLQPAASYLGYGLGDFPVAERLAKQMISLPICPELTDEEIDAVIAHIHAFFEGE